MIRPCQTTIVDGMSNRRIGFVDADCFYVSCERKRDPSLRKLPVGVLSNQKACVIAASYELKSLGIKVGTPAWEVERLCPRAILIERDFQWYGTVSGQLRDLLHQLSPRVEYYSVDEFFFEADDLARTLDVTNEQEAAIALRQYIWNDLALAVSVGLAPSRTLAKLACKQGKPNGAEAWIQKNDIEQRLESIPVDSIAGIAKGRLRRLERIGIQTCGQFRRVDRRLIRDLLTIEGEAFWWELNGEAVQPIRTQRAPRKSMLRGGSVQQPTRDRDVLWAWTVRNSERVIGSLVRERRRCQRIGLSLDFRTLGSRHIPGGWEGGVWNASLHLDRESRSASVILPILRTLFDAGMAYGERHALSARQDGCGLKAAPVSRIHVSALQLVPDETRQLSLFETADSDQIDVLREHINDQQGRFKLRSGSTIPLRKLYADDLSNYDISDIAGKVCF